MTLKIEFQSDIKGFERVQKVLEENQKALNANADALARLNKEQSTLGNSAMDFKGIDSLKNASEAVNKLAKSFDQVMSNQGGMRGFLTTFSGFRKEIGEINKEQGLTVLDTMSKQMEALKGNVTVSLDSLKRLRQEMKDVDPSQPDFVKDYKKSKYNEAAEFVSVNSELLNKLTIQKMMRAPIGQMPGMFGEQLPGGIGGGMAGFMGGGTNLMRMGMIGGGVMAAAYGAEKAAEVGLGLVYAQERGENQLYFQNKSRYDEANSGAISRDFMSTMGIGKEGRFKERLENADSMFTTKIGDSMGEDIGLKIVTGLKRVLRLQLPSAEGMSADLMEQGKEIDAAKNAAFNTASTVTKSTITSGAFRGLEAGKGYDYARKLQNTLAFKNIGFEEGASALFEAKRYGVEDYIASSGLAKDATETGITNNARSEIIRRQYYNIGTKNKAYTDYGKIMSVAGASGIDISNPAYREAISDVVAQRTMNIAGQVDVGAVTAPFQQALGNMQKAGVNLSVPETMKAASGIQDMMNARVGKAGTMESMGNDFALMDLGVNNAPARAALTQLIAGKKGEDAVQIIAHRTGKDPDMIRSRLNMATKQAYEMAKPAIGGSIEGFNKWEGSFKTRGLSFGGAVTSGDATGPMAVAGMWEARENTDLISKDRSKGFASTPIFEDGTGRKIMGEEAKQADAYVSMTAKLANTATDEAGKLVEVFTGYLIKYRMDIQSQMDKMSTELHKKADAPELIKTMQAESLDPKNMPDGPVTNTFGRMLKHQFFGTPGGERR